MSGISFVQSLYLFDSLVSNAHSFKVLLSLSKEVYLLMVTCKNFNREMSICDNSCC